MEFLKPKTSYKTSCFFLKNAMFCRCFWKNIDVDVFDDVLQNAKHRVYDASKDVNRPPLLARGSKFLQVPKLTSSPCPGASNLPQDSYICVSRFICAISTRRWRPKGSTCQEDGTGEVLKRRRLLRYRKWWSKPLSRCCISTMKINRLPFTCFCDEQSVSLSFITTVWW